MKGLEEQVFAFMEEWHMIEPGDRIVAGISGGADSVCLLFLLLEYQKKVPFSLAVCHVNHGMREEAVQDEAYVEGLCKEYTLPFFSYKKDVGEIAKRERLSVEEAGRKVRYDTFREVAGCWKAEKIAVAHHLQDSAETLLLNLFRGTGIWGLTGIRPMREEIIRPLLATERGQIEAYLRERKISWCIDYTNEEDTYTRNKIRLKLLPYVEEQLTRGATRHIAATALEMLELTDYVEGERQQAVKSCCLEEKEQISIRLEEFKRLHPFLQKQVLLWALEKVGGSRKDIGRIHVEELLKLTGKEGYKRISLPGGLEGSKEYGMLWIQRGGRVSLPLEEQQLTIPGSYRLKDGRKLELSLIKKEKVGRIEENQYTKYLDYDKIYNCLTLRSRRQGDYLTIDREGKRKTLKEYMIQEKIAAPARDGIPVIADGSHILWVIGYRISAGYKISEQTKTCLRIKVIRPEYDA
ncbi:MAG: tRNA lysidine(34) synthetase TilS [Lachnospiraceae bacterium]|nr:tRNA lysidine(34) synthetase TilS [Lachnospiraceae bacterium]